MNASVTQPVPWSRGRMWVYFGVVMAIQIILLLVLSERRPIMPRKPGPSIAFYAVTDVALDTPLAALLSLDDPTLFALPHPRGFSGPAWLNAPPLQYQSADWTESPRWLTQSGAQLGATFEEFLRTNALAHRSLAVRPLTLPDSAPVSPLPVRSRSTYRVEGDLAKRELIASLDVPSIAHSDILTNTVVQICVNRSGFTFSPVVISSSGSRNADQQAQDLAKSARFKPVTTRVSSSAAALNDLTWGKIIFHWHTLEMPRTNSPAVQTPQ